VVEFLSRYHENLVNSIAIGSSLMFASNLTCGYGVRANRALATYVAVLLFTGAALRYRADWFAADADKVTVSCGLHLGNYWDSVAIAARNSVTFFGGLSEQQKYDNRHGFTSQRN
jgi:hypothetical protein